MENFIYYFFFSKRKLTFVELQGFYYSKHRAEGVLVKRAGNVR